MYVRLLKLVAICGSSAALYFFLPVPTHVAKGLSILFLAAALWITETLPLPVTALFIPALAVLVGVLGVKEALSSFAHPVIFLFLGGYALAAALHKHSLDVRVGRRIVAAGRQSPALSIGLLFLSTAFISMWVSNTATTVMMLPLALGVLESLGGREASSALKAFVLLGVAYSANIGGIGTLVGSPPNAVTAAVVGVSFSQWFPMGVTYVAVLLPLMVGVLYVMLRPTWGRAVSPPEAKEEPPAGWRGKDVVLGGIALLTVGLWLMSRPISSLLGIEKHFDSVVSLLAVILLVATGSVSWEEIEGYADWGVLILFGGGLTLSVVLDATGASEFLARSMHSLLSGHSPLLLLGGGVALMVFLTELASNTATAAVMVPVFFSLGAAVPSLAPEQLPLAVGVAASCAFMLPVATPPNAIVYGTGLVKQRTMIAVGLVLNLVCVVVITLLAYTIF